MKRFSIVILVFVIASLFGASIAAAQEPEQEDGRPGRRGGRAMMLEIISEATGLDREALQVEGATLASIIEDNGGDVDAVIDQIVGAIVERSDGDPAEIEERITERFNTPHEAREGRRGPRGEAAPEFEGDEA